MDEVRSVTSSVTSTPTSVETKTTEVEHVTAAAPVPEGKQAD
jgi:hypothetical protein